MSEVRLRSFECKKSDFWDYLSVLDQDLGLFESEVRFYGLYEGVRSKFGIIQVCEIRLSHVNLGGEIEVM